MYDLYAIYKQTHPPSAVEHCLVCKFVSSSENNLIIAGISLIRVYRLVDEKSSNDDSVAREFQDHPEPTKKKKLELVGQYSLFGSVKTMKSVRLAGNLRDSLLLSFDDAKLSIVEYDPGTHDLKTISLHYFEEDELKGGMRFHFNDPTVRVDPDNRCAAMWIYSHWLVILPFRQDGVLDDHEASLTSGSKAQVLPSYTLNMRDIDPRLSNIIDVQFLHGYYEPTLLILYEPLKTWPGRLAVRQDTCALVAISVNLTEQVNPIIWSVEQLPFDCCQVLPIPKPIGGILLFATNSILYLNQSVPTYGVSLNSIAKQSTSFPLREQEGIAITLDSAHGSFISTDRVVISLKGGEIYVLSLVTDSVKSVRSFNFDKAAASVQTSCMCSCGDGYLFLGSRLGNSLLLKYTEKAHELFPNGVNPTIPKEGLPPHVKRRKLDSEYIHGLDDLDELEVYGANTKGIQLASYSFEVCDSLLNIGPCACVDMGEPAFLSEEFAETSFPDMELVMCSGYGKNGAVSVLQKSVRPQVVTTFELPGCVDMWTVTSREPTNDDDENATGQGEKSDPAYHSFLILSRKDSSMVLRTEQEIMELDHSGFSTQYPTVCAANLGEGRYILQVTPMGVRLLDGIKQIQHIPMDAGFSSIVWCSVADPYAIMLTADGTLMLLTFTQENSAPSLTVSRVHIDQWSVVCSCCCYKDLSGMFTTEKLNEQPVEMMETTKSTVNETVKPPPTTQTIDDEDELLYGDSDISDVFSGDMSSQQTQPSTTRTPAVAKTDIKPTYWCVLCRENGALEIYSVPDFKLVFCVRNFAVAPKVLVNSGTTGSSGSTQSQDESLVVKEVLLTNLQTPLLAALVDQDLLLYEAFNFADSSTEGHLNIRFKKLQHNVLIREKKKSKATKSSDEDDNDVIEPVVGRLRAFHDISSYSGIFVCGSYPYWLFMTSRKALRSHPMNIDGSVLSFASFRNVNCPKGFLYFNKKGELRVSVLPAHLSYDSPWPVRKIPLRCTPHFVAYNRESKTHAIVSSQMEPCRKITRLGLEDREFHDLENPEDPKYVFPFLDKFSLQLISPVSWEIIPGTKCDLEEYERVTTMKNITLNSEETVSGMKGFIVIGTTYVYGEDLPCKGRILIFDIIEVVPEPGQPLTKNKFKALYQKEQKGPVTALTEVRGFLLSAIGQKIYIWDFKSSNDLVGVAFIDTQLFIHTAISVKNLIMIADISKSVTLLRFQEKTKTLAFVSRDQNPLEVYGAEFFVDGSQLGFLVSDNDMNLVVYRYKPEDPASHGGQKLLHIADINISSCVTSFFRCHVKTEEKTGIEKLKDNRQASWFGTLDGGIGLVLPMPEKTFRRLHMVQNMLMHSIPHYAGLNPRAFRLLRWRNRPLDNSQHHILDFELLSKFVHLGVVERLEVTRKVGVAPAQVLDDLMEIDKLTSHF